MTPERRPNPFVEIVITIVVPSVILMRLSGEGHLGPVGALLLALAFPLGWGVFDGLRRRKLNGFAVLGVVSTLLTGGIGLLKLDPQWLAVKEAAVPGLIGLAVLISTRTRWPLIRTLVYNPNVLDVAKVQQHLEARQTTGEFNRRLQYGTYLLAGTFFFSSTMNYILARWIVVSPAGSEAFNQELGRLTLLSYPMIALPSMAMMLAVLYYLIHGARKLTGLRLSEMLHGMEEAK